MISIEFAVKMFYMVTFGFLMSTHCLAMCGGISCLIGLNNKQSTKVQQFHFLLSYNIGRVSYYVVCGALVNMLFVVVDNKYTPYIRTVLALLFIVAGILMVLSKLHFSYFDKIGLPLWGLIKDFASKAIQRTDTIAKSFVAGFLWGAIPCGLVYAAIGHTVGLTVIESIVLMFCFGLGTMPSQLFVSFFSTLLKNTVIPSYINVLFGCLFIILGILSLPHHLFTH